MKKDNSKEYLDAMRGESSSWKGPFYFNKKDPRIIVPKMNMAMGWTLNFANPYSYIGLAVLFAVIAVIKLFF
jgi:uncharacterized membrane protein